MTSNDRTSRSCSPVSHSANPPPEPHLAAARVVGLALICELDDRRRFSVPTHLIGQDSQVRVSEDVGTLIVPRWVANDHELPITPT